jgi:hypothetical protein
MRLAGYWLAALVLLGASSSYAQQMWQFPAVTADFVAKCKSDRPWCDTTLEDMHLHDAVMSWSRTRYCVPRSLTPDQRIAPVLAWLARHPKLSKKPTRVNLLAASKDLWPCPPTRVID